MLDPVAIPDDATVTSLKRASEAAKVTLDAAAEAFDRDPWNETVKTAYWAAHAAFNKAFTQRAKALVLRIEARRAVEVLDESVFNLDETPISALRSLIDRTSSASAEPASPEPPLARAAVVGSQAAEIVRSRGRGTGTK